MRRDQSLEPRPFRPVANQMDAHIRNITDQERGGANQRGHILPRIHVTHAKHSRWTLGLRNLTEGSLPAIDVDARWHDADRGVRNAVQTRDRSGAVLAGG